MRAAATFLSLGDGTENADWICVTTDDGIRPSGDGWADVAARFCQTRPQRRVLIVDRPPERIVELGAVPTLAAMVRRELRNRGIGEGAISEITTTGRDDWSEARAIGRWLEEQPGATLTFLCGRLDGRRRRLIFDRVLAADAAARVHVVALHDGRWDRRDWWLERLRATEAASALMQLFHVWAMGCPSEPEPRWSPVGYQAALHLAGHR